MILFLLAGRCDRIVVVRKDGGEAGLQTVEVGLLDVVELMVVALGATDGETHEGEAGILGDVVERFLALLDEIRGVDVFRVEAEHAGGDQGVVVVRLELVAGELLADKLVVRQVAVEGADDVVAVFVSVGTETVLFVTFSFAVADDVEPMLCPALAVARRSEQAVDDFDVGVRGGVGEERGLLGRRWREAGEVERDSAEEDRFIGGRIWLELGGFELVGDEIVDGISDPIGESLELGNVGSRQRAERPFTFFELFRRCRFVWLWFGRCSGRCVRFCRRSRSIIRQGR